MCRRGRWAALSDEVEMSRAPESVLLDKAVEAFRAHALHPERRPISAGYAPGRVNIIGEHTDYNEGFVFPMCLEVGTLVLGATRTDGGCSRVLSTHYNENLEIDLSALHTEYHGTAHWKSYVLGVVGKFCSASKVPPDFAFDAVIVGNVPVGGGVSSSASLEVAMFTFLEAATGQWCDRNLKARLCQQAEREYAGVPCGIMDQCVSTFGRLGKALLIDCKTEEITPVQVGGSNVKFLVTNSMVKHDLCESEYPARVKECQESVAAIRLHTGNSALNSLRDATVESAEAAFKANHMSEIAFKRARHVITENARVVRAVEAFKSSDFVSAGQLMHQSHCSLRDDYAVSCKEVDALVEIAMRQEGAFGSRITGGGFGGCVVSLVEASRLEQVQAAISSEYKSQLGLDCVHLVSEPSAGARRVDVAIHFPEQHAYECVVRGQQLKDEGNTLLKAGQYRQALDKYHRIYTSAIGGLMKSSKGEGDSSSPFMPKNKDEQNLSDSEREQVNELARSMHSNKALCYLKLELWEKGIDACCKALELGADEGKLKQRRGICYSRAGMLDKARADLERAQQLSPGDGSIKTELGKLAQLEKRQEEKAKKTFQKMFG